MNKNHNNGRARKDAVAGPCCEAISPTIWGIEYFIVLEGPEDSIVLAKVQCGTYGKL